MGQSPFDRAWIPADLRHVLDALIATATGTLAGILVDSGFGVRDSIVNAVYRLLGPLFDVFSAFPNGQLVAAGFIHRIPIVLIVGMAVGMVLRHIRYWRLLLWSTLVWPVYLVGGRLAFVFLPLIGDNAGRGPASVAPINLIPEIVGYLMQYAFLVLVIHMTNAVAAKSERHKTASPG